MQPLRLSLIWRTVLERSAMKFATYGVLGIVLSDASRTWFSEVILALDWQCVSPSALQCVERERAALPTHSPRGLAILDVVRISAFVSPQSRLEQCQSKWGD